MAAYRPEGPAHTVYCDGVIEDERMARYLLIGAARSGCREEGYNRRALEGDQNGG